MLSKQKLIDLFNDEYEDDTSLSSLKWNDLTSNLINSVVVCDGKNKISGITPIFMQQHIQKFVIKDIVVFKLKDMFLRSIIDSPEYFNDEKYPKMVEELLDLRDEISEDFEYGDYYVFHIQPSKHKTKSLLDFINLYLNSTYGHILGGTNLIDNSNKHKFIKKYNKLLEDISQYIIRAKYQVYYIDTDQIHCDANVLSDKVLMNDIRSVLCDSKHILDIENKKNCIYISKKKYVEVYGGKFHGLKEYKCDFHERYLIDIYRFWLNFYDELSQIYYEKKENQEKFKKKEFYE